jgi:hypothetical protein
MLDGMAQSGVLPLLLVTGMDVDAYFSCSRRQ